MDEVKEITETKRTSKDWNKIHQVLIMDPDGWDRTNFEYSFNEELITEQEFNKRIMNSTIIHNREEK